MRDKLKQSADLLRKAFDERKSGGDGSASIVIACGYILDEIRDIDTRLRRIEQPDLDPVCKCHERDGSYTCDYCKSQGHYGHMERKA